MEINVTLTLTPASVKALRRMNRILEITGPESDLTKHENHLLEREYFMHRKVVLDDDSLLHSLVNYFNGGIGKEKDAFIFNSAIRKHAKSLQLQDLVKREIPGLVEKGKIADAAKRYRELTGASMAASKKVVDVLVSQIHGNGD